MMKKFEEEKKECCDMATTALRRSSPSTTSHHVYIKSPDHGWVPARVISQNKEQALVRVDQYVDEQAMLSCSTPSNNTPSVEVMVDLDDYKDRVLPLQNTTESGELVVYEDMVNLPYLHEPAILYNLKSRHVDGKPYTRSGDVIVAMNPYHWYHHLYQPEEQQYYAQELMWNTTTTPAQLPPPHVYETATLAYKGMALTGTPQSILVSGESGAGKTETVKICMNHIATLQRGPHNNMPDTTEQVVQRVLDSNPLLEAFGNAQTRRNDNSSRFGKYTQLQFDRSSTASNNNNSLARLVGSTCEVYLLEKNRVVSHDSKEERTFHIFYELLAAPREVQAHIWNGLKGAGPRSFSYVGASPTTAIEGVSDGDRFLQTVDALNTVGITGTTQRDLFRALCIVLQLGNLSFGVDPQDDDKSLITSEQRELEHLASLMGLSANNIRLALTERTMTAVNEVYKVPLTAAAAKESCDGLAKDIYEKNFLWLVRTINTATAATTANNNSSHGMIGLLDIFGFEAFFINRFEQLCINYANEKLQQKFTQDCFLQVEAEYILEGIALDQIVYDDNTDVLDLMEGPTTGLLAMLNEECWRPQGNARAFVHKALNQNQQCDCLIVNTMDRLSFGIHHYAGKVLYDAADFVMANQDRLPLDLQQLASQTSNSIVAGEYQAAIVATDNKTKTTTMGPSANSHVKTRTVWTKYKSQLSKLMENLHQTRSRYIRCIKPNAFKQPLLVDHNLTISQLRSCGIVASVTIARSAFPNRMSNRTVLTRFGGVFAYQKCKTASSLEGRHKAEAESLLSMALKSQQFTSSSEGPAFVVGKTKSFFRAGALEYLEAERLKRLDGPATIIQRHYRAFLRHKNVILAARAFRRRKQEHQRMARQRRAKQQAVERARLAAIAEEEEAMERRIQAEWTEFHARMAKEDLQFTAQLDREDANHQARLDAETKAWEEKMQREERDFDQYLKKQRASSSDNELAKLKAEIAELRKQLFGMDQDCLAEMRACDSRYDDARKDLQRMKRQVEDKETNEYLDDAELRRQMLFAKAILEEREKLIDQLKRENKRLMKVLERTEKKKKAIEASNLKVEQAIKDAGAKFENKRRLSMSMNLNLDARQEAYDRAKAENHDLHEQVSQEQEQHSLLSQARLECQHTMMAILEMVQQDSNDRVLREVVMQMNLKVSKDAYQQMKVVQQLQEEAAMRNSQHEHSVSDLHQSFIVH